MALTLYRRVQLRELRPRAQATPDNTVVIEPGVYTKSDGTGFVRKSSAFTSPTFPVVSSGKTRYDLLCLDDTGTAVIVSGVEVTSPGDPITNAPAAPTDKLSLGIIRIDETSTVAITGADIIDVREFLNKGGSGGGGSGGSAKTYTHTQSSSSATWTVTHNLGSNDVVIQIYDATQGNMLIPDTVDIIDTNSLSITFSAAQTGKAVVVGGASGGLGAQGPQGWQGVAGTVGVNGAQGPQGNQGWQGFQGNQGWQGVAGQGSSYIHTQGSASTSWAITHNLNSSNVLVQVYDGSNSFIVPNSIVITSNNVVTIGFTVAQAGKAVIAGY